MVEDRLSNSLSDMGYRRIDSNAQGIYLFYHADENVLSIVSVIHAPSGNELTVEQYEHILEQIKNNFINSYTHKIRLLSLVFTSNPNSAKHLCINPKENSHWIVDNVANRLMIYETGSNEFAEFQDKLEQLLEEEQLQNLAEKTQPYNHDGSKYQGGRKNRQPYSPVRLTPVNTVIFVINVIAFLILHYTGVFGGEAQMLGKGSLSWYYIKEGKEYYRILTSMFMHADWSHLINNMIVLLFIGENLERAVGKIKYLFIYFGAGIIAGITSISYNMWNEYSKSPFEKLTYSVGASGAIFGVVGAILLIVIINKGRLEEISTRQMILFIVLSLYSGIMNARIDQAAHIGGFLAGLLIAVIVYRRPKRAVETKELGKSEF
jgi:rhomboid protease GluP